MDYKLKPYPLKGYEFPQNIVWNEDDPFTEAATKLGAHIAELVDDELVKVIVEHAEKEGFTHLYLLDKTFVENALKHELERWKEDNPDC